MVLSYTYDAVGNRLSVGDNFGVTVASTYDARDLLSSRTWSGGGIDSARVEFDYNARGQRTETRRYADALGTQQIGRSTFDYDAVGRLTDIEHRDALEAVFADYDRLFDLAGQLTQDSHHGQTADYSYDAAGQLTATDHTGQTDESYAYDENGNRVNGSNVIGPNNRLLSDGSFNYAYDNEGNLVTKTEIATGTVTTFAYDHRNRLTKLERRDSTGTLVSEVEFTYDVFDRRIAKTVDADGDGPQAAETLHFVYDGLHVWADFHADGSIAVRYLHGDRIDEIIARFRPTEGTAWYLTDALGTVRDIADASGAVINHVNYDSFGNVVSETNQAAGDRYKFTGREHDAETGLYYYRARYYDPTTGRFISQDPIGFAAGDANLYRYVGNTPTTYVDPLGNLSVSYAQFVNYATRTANSLAGGVIGYVCGYVEAWHNGSKTPHQDAIDDLMFGAAIGYALAATPQKFQLYVGIGAAIYALGTSKDAFVFGLRATCLGVGLGVSNGIQKAVPKLLNKPSVRNGLEKAGKSVGEFLASDTGAQPLPGGAPKGSANPNTKKAAGRGSSLHADKPGNLPDQLRAKFPETDLEFKPPGKQGQDVEVVGGKHPSEYPESNWPEGVDFADFKPDTPGGQKTFKSDQKHKWAEDTQMLPYDPGSGDLVD